MNPYQLKKCNENVLVLNCSALNYNKITIIHLGLSFSRQFLLLFPLIFPRSRINRSSAADKSQGSGWGLLIKILAESKGVGSAVDAAPDPTYASI